MKILHILNELKFSGAEIMYVDAAPVFQQLGCELSVVNTAPELGEYAVYFEKAGYQVFHKVYPKSYIKRWNYYCRMIRFLKRNRYDAVHIHRNDMKWGMSMCAWVAGKKAIYTFHNVFRSHWYSYLYHWWLRWSAKNMFHCIFQTISDSVYENEKNYYHNETVKIYNWYGNNRFFPASGIEKIQMRRELNISSDTLVLISVGGCSPIKRHSEILKALPLIAREIPDCLYLHLGAGISEPEEQALANELGISKFVHFLGNQKDVRKYLIASDLYIMSSRFEGISLTTIEAMACNIPAILYNVPGLRDFNKEKKCSLLIEEDFLQLAKNAVYLYKNKDRQKELTANARQLVDSLFDMQTNALKIFELYQGNS